jgi:tRNA(fMet)-specific endonuclease VapC
MKFVYLLDTNIVSEPLKPVPDSGVLEHLDRFDGLMAIPSVVWHELIYGLNRLQPGDRQRRLRSYLFDVVAPTLPVLAYDDHAAWIHATLRSSLDAVGRPQGFADGIIAATAMANNLILVTRNTADFDSVPSLYTENWFDA